MELRQTTKAEALAIIKKLPFVNAPTITEEAGAFWEGKQKTETVDLNWQCKNIEAHCGSVTFVADVLERVDFRLYYSVTLAEAIDQLGTPDYMFILATSNACKLDFVWVTWQLKATYDEDARWFSKNTCQLMDEGDKKPSPQLILEYVSYLPRDYFADNPENVYDYVAWPGLADQ